MSPRKVVLFGGERPWSPVDWTASDDRVRGGKSQSYLNANAFEDVATFHGNLDITTLGGAGFASQRTSSEDKTWDLSAYDGIALDISSSDKKRYTFIVKDEILPPNSDNGREQAVVSYEFDFTPGEGQQSTAGREIVFVPWKALKPTYRGKPKDDAEPLNLKRIKRFSIMMRSFFGDQEGPFKLGLRKISATKEPSDDVSRKSEGKIWQDIEGGRSVTSNSVSKPEIGNRARLVLVVGLGLLVMIFWARSGH